MRNMILIVDDLQLNIDILSATLDELYDIMEATGGAEAIELLKASAVKPDLVLLDLDMPGINGFGVLEFIKSQRELSNIPVIFVTGEHDTESEAKGLMLGAVDYVKKPFNSDIVNFKVMNHLELKLYRDNLEVIVRERTAKLEETTLQLAASRETIIMGMSLLSEIHDKVTGDHILRIKEFTRILSHSIAAAHANMLSEDLAKQITLYSPLHDVGKVAITDTILKKTGKLTPEEFDIMKSHAVEGGELLRKTDEFLRDHRDGNDIKVAIEIAEGHHEKFDGSGYPYGLKGDEIPISSRIVALADIYDALRSPRPYKEAFTHDEAVNIILSGDGRVMPEHFDPIVLDSFNEELDLFNAVYV